MIVMAYPYDAMTNPLILKNPELHDTRGLATGVKVKTMMDGTLRTRIKTPATTRLAFRWSELGRLKTLELINFLTTSAGGVIRLIDFNGVSWRGKILTNPFNVVVNTRGIGSNDVRQESGEISLEFEGVMIG